MKKLFFTFIILFALFGFVSIQQAFADQFTHPLYSSWNIGIGDHFYTMDEDEWNRAVADGWAKQVVTIYILDEPVTFLGETAVPLYRAWNGRDHFYTTSEDEVKGAAGYQREDITGYVFENKVLNSVPLFRSYHGSIVDHFYTINEDEWNRAVGGGWRQERIEGYVFDKEIIVRDDIPPTFIRVSGTSRTTSNPSGTSVPPYDIAATNHFGGSSAITCNPPHSFIFPIGTTLVECIATDSLGNKNTKILTVTIFLFSTAPPVITVPSDIQKSFSSVELRIGRPFVIDQNPPTAIDDIDGTIFPECKIDPTGTPVGPFFSTGKPTYQIPLVVGIHSIKCTAIDSHQNPATPKSFTVTITEIVAPPDRNPPVIPTMNDITVTATSAKSVSWFTPTAIDPETGPYRVGCAPLPGSQFNIGTTLVTCTATDSAGNIGTETFNVIVNPPVGFVDKIPPIISLQKSIKATATSNAGAVVIYKASAKDNIDGVVTVDCSPPSGFLFRLGGTTVTCTATDSSFNTATKKMNVSIRPLSLNTGDKPPQLFIGRAQVQTPITSSGAIVIYKVLVFDREDGRTLIANCTPESGTLFPLGPFTISCDVKDKGGNMVFKKRFGYVR